MEFKREEIYTLTGENGVEIGRGNSVMYKVKNSELTILAVYLGLDKGYLKFRPYNEETEYRVKPSTIDSLWRVQEVKF